MTHDEGAATPSELQALATSVELSGAATALARSALGREVHSNLQISTVLAIANDPGVGPADLAARAGVLLPSMSRVLRTLSAAGLVRVVRGEADARYRHLYLTDAGQEGVDRFRTALVRVVSSEEVARVPLLLGVTDPGDDSLPVDVAVSRFAGVAGGVAEQTRRLLGGHAPPDGESVWVVVTLRTGLVTPRPGVLAEHLHTSRPTMTGHLNRLEAAGLVTRHHPDDTDGRVVEVALTPAGMRVGDAWVAVLRAQARAFGTALADAVATARAHAAATSSSVEG